MASNVNADAFIPKIWDASVLRTLEDNLIAKKITSSKAKKAIAQAGDTVYFNSLADPAVSSYTGSLSYEDLVSTQIALLIDQQNYYAFKTTDPEEVMSEVDLKGSQAERAAYQLQRACDIRILAEYANAYHTIEDETCDTTTIFSDLGLAKQRLAENNVMENDMYAVIPPWVALKLELAGIVFSINNGINGKGGMSFAKVLGFDVLVSNNVNNSGTATNQISNVLCGSYNAIVYADKLQKSEMFRSHDAFEYLCRGLHIFGTKTVKSKELVNLKLTYVAEEAV